MSYISGADWHTTSLEGKTIVWVTNNGVEPAVASVLDPESDHPARRILQDGTVVGLKGADRGLTVYGTYQWDRPGFERFRELAPEYAHLVDGIERHSGITHHRITTADEVNYLNAAEVADLLGVATSTVYRYNSQGAMPAPDRYAGRTPLWKAATIKAWERPGRGAGGGRKVRSALGNVRAQ